VALLEELARKTGGEVIAAENLSAFARGLPARKAPVMETALNPLWHTPVMFIVALACFLREWGLRRWKGGEGVEPDAISRSRLGFRIEHAGRS